MSYDLAFRERPFLFLLAREIVFNLARVLILPFLALLFYFYPQAFVPAFLTAAAFSLLYQFLRE